MRFVYFKRKFKKCPYGIELDDNNYVTNVVKNGQADNLNIINGWRLETISQHDLLTFSQIIPETISIAIEITSQAKFNLEVPLHRRENDPTDIGYLKSFISDIFPGKPFPSEIELYLSDLPLVDVMQLKTIINNDHSKVKLRLKFSRPFSDFYNASMIEKITKTISESSIYNKKISKISENVKSLTEMTENVNKSETTASDSESNESPEEREEVLNINFLPFNCLLRIIVLIALFSDSSHPLKINYFLGFLVISMYFWSSNLMMWFFVKFFPNFLRKCRERSRSLTLLNLKNFARRIIPRDLISSFVPRNGPFAELFAFVYGFIASISPHWEIPIAMDRRINR